MIGATKLPPPACELAALGRAGGERLSCCAGARPRPRLATSRTGRARAWNRSSSRVSSVPVLIAPLLASVVLALPGAQVRTTLHVFSPWAGSIPARAVTIDRTLGGACSHGSGVLTRSDAWHCSAGGRAYDPCFGNTRAEA